MHFNAGIFIILLPMERPPGQRPIIFAASMVASLITFFFVTLIALFFQKTPKAIHILLQLSQNEIGTISPYIFIFYFGLFVSNPFRVIRSNSGFPLHYFK
jgi:hypothetical protein